MPLFFFHITVYTFWGSSNDCPRLYKDEDFLKQLFIFLLLSLCFFFFLFSCARFGITKYNEDKRADENKGEYKNGRRVHSELCLRVQNAEGFKVEKRHNKKKKTFSFCCG